MIGKNLRVGSKAKLDVLKASIWKYVTVNRPLLYLVLFRQLPASVEVIVSIQI